MEEGDLSSTDTLRPDGTPVHLHHTLVRKVHAPTES